MSNVLLDQAIKNIIKPFTRSFDYIDLIEDVLDRIEIDDVTEDKYYDILHETIDDTIIYNKQQWVILEEHCNPTTAQWEDAYEWFEMDCDDVLFEYLRLHNERKQMYESK